MIRKSLIALLALFMSTAASAQLPAYLPVTDLMAWFPFTGNAIDSTMHGHDGVVTGTTNAKGRYGVANTAFNFNGTSDFIYVPAGTLERDKTIDITSSLTISAWVKSYNYAFTSQQQIYWRGDATPAHDPHMLYLNGGEVRIRRDVDPGSVVNETGTSFAGLDTNYHMFTGTYDSASGMMRVYIDGIMKNSAYLPGFQTYPTSTMYNYIGAVDGGTWQFFYGMIDELGIWRRALSPCEILALYGSVPNIITGQPVNDTAATGGTATFSVSVAAPAATYRWQVNTGSGYTNLSNGTPYSGVTTPILTVTPATNAMSGYLYRCIISSDSCLSVVSDSAKLKIDTVVVMADTRSNEPVNFTLSPNPANGTFMLSGTVLSATPVTLMVTDIAGHVVYKDEAVAVNGTVSKKVTLGSKVSNGIYFVRVSDGANSQTLRLEVKR